MQKEPVILQHECVHYKTSSVSSLSDSRDLLGRPPYGHSVERAGIFHAQKLFHSPIAGSHGESIFTTSLMHLGHYTFHPSHFHFSIWP